MRQFIALVGLFFVALPVVAQTPSPPTITRAEGQVTTAVWPDGREAQYWVSRGASFPGVIPFKVSENGCKAGANGAEVSATWHLRLDRLAWVWTKHSDATKLNQVVVAHFPGGMKLPLSNLGFITNNTLHLYPDLGLSPLPRDSYQFSDLSWLPGMETGLSDFTIELWNSEAMIPNSQTGLSENRVVSGGSRIAMAKVAEDRVEMSQAGSIYSLFQGENAFALLGDVVSWKWQAGGQSCWISFKPNLGPIRKAVNDQLASERVEFAPYVLGQDSLTKIVIEFSSDVGLNYAE